ncbi:bifunctional ADP-dependent NAD(P)H-hydrate dehydratase/NAD(P)H-hydrate epimerase [Streptomyces albiaxialis]|uniref:Bifunctional NAD(P)H-hydrate repair enzyme n=1 Tax=Streptomyces albiaxialis TaxID=329523 RepID=A0ABP5HG20_9ACTN
MRYAYRVETVRTAERELMARLPEGMLMRRAAAGLAAACRGLLGRTYGARVVLLVGSGDNGGDALYAGAELARRGAGVTAVLLSPERAHEGGLRALRAAGGRAVGGVPSEPYAELIGRADLVVDGIVGIGGKGGLRPVAVELTDLVRDAGVPVVAVDLPSGVDADTGEVNGQAVRAGATVTFGTYKPGLLVDPAHEHTGAVRLVDIGLDACLPRAADMEALQHADVARLLPRPGAESDKYRRGVVGVAAGSGTYPGAAVLAVAGALRGGAGAVRYLGESESVREQVIRRFPETLLTQGPVRRAGRVQAWAVGSGLGDGSAARELVADVLTADLPVLVDADGLRLMDVSAVRERTAPTVLTPHAGEAAALLGRGREEVEAARLASVRELAELTGATVLLKGSTTLVADADRTKPVRVNATGTGWLATAGSGDVLSGAVGSLLAAGLDALDAASVGAYLHGLAARHAAPPLTAMDVAHALPHAWQSVTN